MVGWENSNSAVESPTHQSINPADRLKILTISTWLVEQVGRADKCNELNEIISIKLDNCFPQIKKKGNKKLQSLVKIITNTTLFYIRIF